MRNEPTLHGLRSARLSPGCAPPVATFRRPVGAKTIPISQGGTDEEHNLRAVCVWYNKDKANLKVPTSRDAISAMALIRRQPRDVQQEVYEFLAKKFGKKSGGK